MKASESRNWSLTAWRIRHTIFVACDFIHSFLYCRLTFEESRDLDWKRAELAFGLLRAGRNPRRMDKKKMGRLAMGRKKKATVVASVQLIIKVITY